MTKDEAINTLKNAAWLGWAEQAEKVSEAVRMAVEALEKQIPREPVYVAEDRYVKNMYAMFPQCPSCGHEIAPGDVFCLMCGQAIDRRKEDD